MLNTKGTRETGTKTGISRDNPDIFENAVASLVDVASILFAYQIGVYGFGLGVGALYAIFDAFLVIWMRKPISRFARAISPFRVHRISEPADRETPLPSSTGTAPGPRPELTPLSPEE